MSTLEREGPVMAKKEEAAAEDSTSTPQAAAKREAKKSRWTPALCMKFARRFDSEGEWASGAPSSYKAAVARGFVADCTKHMKGTSKVAAKTAAKKPPAKKKKKICDRRR